MRPLADTGRGRSTRAFLTRALACFLVATTGCASPPPGVDVPFADAVRRMEKATGGAIGVYAVDTETGRELAYRADDRFAMASTFKVLLAASVLAEVDAGRLLPDGAHGIEGVEIQPHSPVIGEMAAGGTLSLAELCEAVVTVSDNTAANMLLELIGGPAGLTGFLRRHGDPVTRLDRVETALNTNLRGDDRDTTTPRAMVLSLRRFLVDGALSERSSGKLRDLLVASRTGSTRLRAGLPAAWRAGDKTGTGMNGAVNDVAIAWPPGRRPVVIAVYMSGSDEDVATLSALHAAIASAIVDRLGL